MSISAVVLNGTIQHQQNLSTLKQNADDKGMTEQSNISAYLNKNSQSKAVIVEFSNRSSMQQRKQDAKDKGKNEYHGDGGRNRKEKEKNTGIYYEDWDEGPRKLVMLKMPDSRPHMRFDLKV